MSEPPHGTEVFVGGIPRTASEDQLKVFAEAVGEVHAVVLLKDPQNNEQNRGCVLTSSTTYSSLSSSPRIIFWRCTQLWYAINMF